MTAAPDETLRLAAAHVVVDAAGLDGDGGPQVEAADMRHLDRVLRLRPGEIVTATDGAGRWRSYRWRGGEVELEPDGPVVNAASPTPSITVGFTPVKGDRPEWTVAKLTELGVDTIIPLHTARSVVRWSDDRASDHVGRLRRVAREATMQSRRCHIPQILDVASPSDVAGAAMAQFGGGPVSLDTPVVLIGPEGGWSPAELDLGLEAVSLGPLVLRAETAALAAAVLLTSLRHDAILTVRGRHQ